MDFAVGLQAGSAFDGSEVLLMLAVVVDLWNVLIAVLVVLAIVWLVRHL